MLLYVTTHEERVRQTLSHQAFMSTLGAELTAVVQGGVEIRLPFSPNLTQRNGYLHAGAITAVLDSACGYAALTVAADCKEVLTRRPLRARSSRLERRIVGVISRFHSLTRRTIPRMAYLKAILAGFSLPQSHIFAFSLGFT
jgi:acyl-coenzyme A thioesterase PaaI-like protein